MDRVVTVQELAAAIDLELQQARERIEAYDERAALQAVDDGKTTDQRAVDALSRPERFPGERNIALAWLFHSPTARIWTCGKRAGR